MFSQLGRESISRRSSLRMVNDWDLFCHLRIKGSYLPLCKVADRIYLSSCDKMYCRTIPANTRHCWTNVGPPSTTLAQHWSNIGSTLSTIFCRPATPRSQMPGPYYITYIRLQAGLKKISTQIGQIHCIWPIWVLIFLNLLVKFISISFSQIDLFAGIWSRNLH